MRKKQLLTLVFLKKQLYNINNNIQHNNATYNLQSLHVQFTHKKQAGSGANFVKQICNSLLIVVFYL